MFTKLFTIGDVELERLDFAAMRIGYVPGIKTLPIPQITLIFLLANQRNLWRFLRAGDAD